MLKINGVKKRETVPLALPSESTPAEMRIKELFKKGTEPNEISWRYEKLEKHQKKLNIIKKIGKKRKKK